uniref:sin3 histone deacetylase corepressor complex component SDS3 isoform X1 n=1 Tax=Myxine glutinosa TaxID=7769 RepID=UPI00358E6B93
MAGSVQCPEQGAQDGPGDAADSADEVPRSGRNSDEDTEDASETDMAKREDGNYVEMKEQMFQDKVISLKKQVQQLQEGTLLEYQKRMKRLDQQYKERIRHAEIFVILETEQVERRHVQDKHAAVKEFDDKKVELKDNLIAELEEKRKMIENERLTMELTDSMEVKAVMTRKLRRRPNDPIPLPDKRRKPTPSQLNYALTEEQVCEDLKCMIKGKSLKSSLLLDGGGMLLEVPLQRCEARIDDGKLHYDNRWFHKSQPVYLESRDSSRISCVISSIGTNEVWVRKTTDSSKIRVYLSQLQRGKYSIRSRPTP